MRLKDGTPFTAESLAVAWWTSLTALSAEVEGHSLGGGMLKLEPGEAVRVLLPLPSALLRPHDSSTLIAQLDALIRLERYEEALDLGDRELLQMGVGVSTEDCLRLREGFHSLMRRRRGR